jgi:tetratricopeptide (TPR) repeat protein
VRSLSTFSCFNAPALIAVVILFCVPLAAQRGSNPDSTTHMPTFSVRGKVLGAEDHVQLAGVRVELRTFTGVTVGIVITRASGDFEFLNVGVGSYDVIVQQSGYHTATQRVDVQQSIIGVSIELHSNSPASASTLGPSSVSSRELSIPRKAHDAMNKGLALIQEKSDYQKSIKEFNRAIHYYPEYYEAYTEMGVAYMHMGNNAGAEPALRKALEISREQDVEVLAWLATLLNDGKRFNDAEPLARKGLELDSSSWQANAELARSLLGLHRAAEAEKSALAASKLRPDNALLYLVLANVHGRLENGPALLEDLDNYLRLVPTGSIADQARAQRKQLQDELQHAQQTSLPPTMYNAINDGAADAPSAAVVAGDDSQMLKSSGKERKPVLWPPINVDAAVPSVTTGVSCPLQDVLKGARKRVQELLENVDRFSATEVVDFSEIGQDGRASRSLKYTFDYLAAVSLSRDGDLRYEESRKEIGKFNSTSIPIKTVGLAVGAAVFHPLRFDDFEMTCEGLGQWHDKPAWQLRFEQRPDKPPRFQAILDNGNWFDVKLKGRAWIGKETSQIEHIDFDLLETISRIRLQTEHMSIDYRAVEFPKRNLQLWLPESASFYIDISGHRFLNRHLLSNYLLFSVDADQKIQSPPKPK